MSGRSTATRPALANPSAVKPIHRHRVPFRRRNHSPSAVGTSATTRKAPSADKSSPAAYMPPEVSKGSADTRALYMWLATPPAMSAST